MSLAISYYTLFYLCTTLRLKADYYFLLMKHKI